MPHVFMKKVCGSAKIRLPAPGEYGVATVFLSPYASERQQCQKAFEEIVKAEGQRFLGWRTVPTNHANVGATARAAAPDICQAFIGRDPKIDEKRVLFVCRIDRIATFGKP